MVLKSRLSNMMPPLHTGLRRMPFSTISKKSHDNFINQQLLTDEPFCPAGPSGPLSPVGP